MAHCKPELILDDDQAFVSVSLIMAIFMNLGGKRKKGELSAYSVFNKGFHQLPGQPTLLPLSPKVNLSKE